MAVLGLLISQWHGLVPPIWQSAVALQGPLTATPLCYLLSVFFLLGAFYHFAVSDDTRWADWRGRPTWIAAALGLLVVLFSPTDYNVPSGRWGGYLWWASNRLPVIGHGSLLFVLLAPAGAALLAVMTRRLVRQAGSRLAWLWLGSFLAWAATALSNRLVFHRYFEPTILVFLVFWVSCSWFAPSPPRL